MDRRTALALLLPLVARTQPQPANPVCGAIPERLVIDFGAGACAMKALVVKQGALSATIPVADLLKVIGAKVGG